MIPSPLLPFLLLYVHSLAAARSGGGRWDCLIANAGVSAMHMQLLNTDRVVIFDTTNLGPSNISFPDDRCPETKIKTDCTAHSVEYDVASNSVRPVTLLTDALCSSGATMPDGTLLQTGGTNEGDRNVRTYKPCRDNSCDWREISGGLLQRRWYATNHILPDGRQIIIGGRRQFNYELYPKIPGGDRVYNLPFLLQTNDPSAENNLYPFVILNVDGNLFIFANNRAILFDYIRNTVVKIYPTIPGGAPRNYPSSGSAVLLPLKNLEAGIYIEAEVLVCGGAEKGAFAGARNGHFLRALKTCGRIRITDLDPAWVIQKMPMGRVMGDMVLLPNGNVLIINGAGLGTAGWELGRDPVLNPVVYRPEDSVFEVQSSSLTPRMYHSTAVLLRDGRVLVGGSNPHATYKFADTDYPTDLSLESFSPSYLNSDFASIRPHIIAPISGFGIKYGQEFVIRFTIPLGRVDKASSFKVTMVAPSFATHSFSMNQRLLVLSVLNVNMLVRDMFEIRVLSPSSGRVAPSGYYLLFVVYKDIPSEGIWIHISRKV